MATNFILPFSPKIARINPKMGDNIATQANNGPKTPIFTYPRLGSVALTYIPMPNITRNETIQRAKQKNDKRVCCVP